MSKERLPLLLLVLLSLHSWVFLVQWKNGCRQLRCAPINITSWSILYQWYDTVNASYRSAKFSQRKGLLSQNSQGCSSLALSHATFPEPISEGDIQCFDWSGLKPRPTPGTKNSISTTENTLKEGRGEKKQYLRHTRFCTKLQRAKISSSLINIWWRKATQSMTSQQSKEDRFTGS